MKIELPNIMLTKCKFLLQDQCCAGRMNELKEEYETGSALVQ